MLREQPNHGGKASSIITRKLLPGQPCENLGAKRCPGYYYGFSKGRKYQRHYAKLARNSLIAPTSSPLLPGLSITRSTRKSAYRWRSSAVRALAKTMIFPEKPACLAC